MSSADSCGLLYLVSLLTFSWTWVKQKYATDGEDLNGLCQQRIPENQGCYISVLVPLWYIEYRVIDP